MPKMLGKAGHGRRARNFIICREDNMELNEIIEKYQRLREQGKNLSSDLAGRVPRQEYSRMLKPFGVIQGMNVDCSETEGDVLMDYLLYTCRIKGKPLARVRLESMPPPNPEQRELLRAMEASRYIVFRVEEVLPGAGVVANDFFWQRDFFLVDLSMSSSTEPGKLFAGRLLDLGEFHMTTGAIIPMTDELMEHEVGPFGAQIMNDGWRPGDGLDEARQKNLCRRLIKAALKLGVLKQVAYR